MAQLHYCSCQYLYSMKRKIKVCHLTSGHSRFDVRVFVKQCTSLVNNGFDVSLIVADGLPDEVVNGVKIYGVKKEIGRLNRFIKASKSVYQKALELNCEVYQLHDPELMPYGLKLRKKGKIVIFDAHEDLPQQLKSKPYLNTILRAVLPYMFERYENYAFKKFDYLLGATPFITNKLKKINKQSVNVNNYPILGELGGDVQWEEKKNEISYIGLIAQIRGVNELVEAMQFVKSNVQLNLVGAFNDKQMLSELKKNKGWERVNYFGLVSRERVSELLTQSKVGIVTFLGVPNHINSQPNKMFEYMSAGLPIITSNFQMWKEVVEGNECGITVNPENPKEIANAIDQLILDDVLAYKKGENGKKAVLEKYNWQAEEKKLIEMYNSLT